MRLLHGIGIGIAGGVIWLVAAGAASAQNSQPSTQTNGNGTQTNGNGSTGSTLSSGSNLPYKPPAPPPGGYGDASSDGSFGKGAGGYGGTQSGGSGGYGTGASGSPASLGHILRDNSATDDTPQNQQQMEMQQARARNEERQKQLVSDTQRLVALANELQDEVSKSNKDMLSVDVVRKADEIDKLARNVRDRMKNAN